MNIQLLALPATVPAGFKSELVMIVTNNGSSTMVNVSPNTPSNSDTVDCALGTVSPTIYNTLVPGSTAVFKWDVTAGSRAPGGTTCTFSLTQPLQNGYSQSVSATVTITVVSLSSTTYSQNSGVITNDYTAFRWTQGNTWNTDWSFPSCTTTDFKVTIANNNQTAGGYNLWISKNSQIFFYPTSLVNPNAKIASQPYYIVNSVTLSPLGITQYTDNSVGIPNQGGIATLYFGAASAGSGTQQTGACGNQYPYGLAANTPYYGSIVIYGKFTKNSGDTSGGNYAQTIPFLAIMSN